MKIFKKYILGSIFLLTPLLQMSCKKEFLEIVPKGQTIAINTSDYEMLLNANNISTTQFDPNIYRGDEIAGLQPYFDNLGSIIVRRQQRLFRYEDRVYDTDQLPDEITNDRGYIRRLYVFNKIINEVMDSKQGTEAQKTALLSEAKVARAICNFLFLSHFTKPYNATSAAKDLGIPNLTAAEVTQKDFKRGTLQQAYDLIIRDLTEALPNLGVVKHRRKISRLAAEFYLARVYFAMNDYTAAKAHLDAAFLELPKATIRISFNDYTIVLDPANPTATGSWFPSNNFGFNNEPQFVNNTEIIFNVTSLWAQLQSADAFVFSPQTASLYSSTDRRLNLFNPLEFQTNINPKPLGMRRRANAMFTGIDVGSSLADMYLMRAEIKARANDLTGAVADIEVLRAKRIAGTAAQVPSSIISNQQALVRFILDERIREFAITGLRWLDMRRLSQDPIYNTHIDYTHRIYNANGAVHSTYQLRPERFALKFGERMLNENNGLEENP